jgi:hypothetical protein
MACALLGLLVVPVVAGELAASKERRVSDALVQLAAERFTALSAVAQRRLELLDEARRLLARAEDDGEDVLAGRAAVEDARRGALPGDRLDAVDRVLRAHADRRARRAGATTEAPAGPPA